MEPVRGNHPFPLLSLPEDPLAKIIKFLKPDDLRNLRLVNHQLLVLTDERRESIELRSLPNNERRPALMHLVANWHRWPKLKSLDVSVVNADDEDDNHTAEFFEILGSPLQGLENAAWADLEDLNLADCRLGEAGGIGLARAAKHWRRLRVLNLADNFLTANAVITLSEVSLPLLEDLTLSGNMIGPAIGAALAKGAPQWPSLRNLSLQRVRLIDAGLEALLSARFPFLEAIDLSYNRLELAAGFVFVNAATQWPNLCLLNLGDNYISSPGLQRLATAHLNNLEVLIIGGDDFNLESDGVRALREGARDWPRLRIFKLMTFEELDIRGLFKGGGWEALEYLALGGDNISLEEELMNAVSSQQLPSLKQLDLSRCNYMSGNFIETMFRCPWSTLEELYIDYCDAENGVADALARLSIKLPSLRILSLREYDLSVGAIRSLMKSFGSLEKLDLSTEIEDIIFSWTSNDQADEAEPRTAMLTYT